MYNFTVNASDPDGFKGADAPERQKTMFIDRIIETVENVSFARKLAQTRRLLAEFPWLWAIKDAWGLDYLYGAQPTPCYTIEFSLPDEVVVWRVSLTELGHVLRIHPTSSWWVHLEATDGERVRRVPFPNGEQSAETLSNIRQAIPLKKNEGLSDESIEEGRFKLAHLALRGGGSYTYVICAKRGGDLHQMIFSDDLARLCS